MPARRPTGSLRTSRGPRAPRRAATRGPAVLRRSARRSRSRDGARRTTPAALPASGRGGRDRHLTGKVGELVEVVVVVGRALRERTDPLDACEQIRLAVLLKDTAEQLAQHSHVVAEREVRVVRHVPSLFRSFWTDTLAR